MTKNTNYTKSEARLDPSAAQSRIILGSPPVKTQGLKWNPLIKPLNPEVGCAQETNRRRAMHPLPRPVPPWGLVFCQTAELVWSCRYRSGCPTLRVPFPNFPAIRSSLFLVSLLAVPRAPAQTIAAPSAPGPNFEWQGEFSAAGSSAIFEGSQALGELSHRHAAATTTATLRRDRDSSYSAGLSWRRFEFSGSQADVPGSLTSLALKLGYARTFSPIWSLRAEVDPGIYSDFEDISGDDLNVPLGVRLLYATSRELQWAFAIFVDPRSSVPVIGGVGARWRFAPSWTLLAFLPAPRVEYALSDAFSLYVGASMRGGTFRVAEDFGRRRGRPELDHEDVDFREITAGAGGRWQIQPALALNFGVGWMIDRRFEFEERDLLINGDGAPSATLSLSGAF